MQRALSRYRAGLFRRRVHFQSHSRAMATTKLGQPTHLILDYDGTLTCKDTMAIFGVLPRDPKLTWQEIVDAYMHDYQIYKDTPFPWKYYDRTEYSKWLAARKWVEANSAQRVQDAGFFRGVTQDELNRVVSQSVKEQTLQLRDGWLDLFEAFLPHYDPSDGSTRASRISILSVNWSEKAIRRALYEAAKSSNQSDIEKLGRYIYDVEVNANEIDGLDSPYGSSGRVTRPLLDIRTSDDKLRFFPPREERNKDPPLTVYIGDSSTDFDCLCAADLGIWLCDVPEAQYKQSAEETFKPLNFVPPPLSSISTPAEARELFYWAPNFDVVRNVICAK